MRPSPLPACDWTVRRSPPRSKYRRYPENIGMSTVEAPPRDDIPEVGRTPNGDRTPDSAPDQQTFVLPDVEFDIIRHFQTNSTGTGATCPSCRFSNCVANRDFPTWCFLGFSSSWQPGFSHPAGKSRNGTVVQMPTDAPLAIETALRSSNTLLLRSFEPCSDISTRHRQPLPRRH